MTASAPWGFLDAPRETYQSTKACKPDPLLLVKRAEEPQQGWPDGDGRLPHGGKTLAQLRDGGSG